MKFIGAWCPDEMVDAVEVWIKREKKTRRVNRTDFLVEAARAMLIREGIPIPEEIRTGENRETARPVRYPAPVPDHHVLNSKPDAAGLKLLKKGAASVSYSKAKRRRSRGAGGTSGPTSGPAPGADKG